MAFNPETGAMHKVWQGKMDFRGKVWDFSQDNSRAEGRIYFAAPNELWRLPDDGKFPAGCTSNNVVPDKQSWTFSSGAFVTSPTIDATGWHRVFVAFDETSKKGRFKVTVSDDQNQTEPQWFTSATSVGSDTDWQWNFKRIERPSSKMIVKVESPVAKKLRQFRIYGDKSSWFDGKGHELAVIWDGYELVNQTKAVRIHLRLQWPGDQVTTVTQVPEVNGKGWKEEWAVQGIPKGETVILRREGLSEDVRIEGDAYSNGAFNFGQDGSYRARFVIPEVSR
jgi:hypothetical protein